MKKLYKILTIVMPLILGLGNLYLIFVGISEKQSNFSIGVAVLSAILFLTIAIIEIKSLFENSNNKN